MKTKNKIAIATCAGMATLAPFAANAHHHGANAFWAGMAGGAIGAAVGNALTAPRAVVVDQGTVVATPVVNQTVVAAPVVQDTVIATPIAAETVIAQPVATTTVIPTTTVVPTTTILYDTWGRPLPPPAVIPVGHPAPFWGPGPRHFAPAPMPHHMTPHGGIPHGMPMGHHPRSGCRGR